MKEAGNGGGLLAIAQPAHSAAKVLDEPPNPAFIVLPLFQGSVFLGVIVKYLFVIMRRLIFIEQGGQLSGANSSLFLPWGVRWHYKAARATGHRSSINAASPWDRADAIPSLLRLSYRSTERWRGHSWTFIHSQGEANPVPEATRQRFNVDFNNRSEKCGAH
jgi:hypothetical protein